MRESWLATLILAAVVAVAAARSRQSGSGSPPESVGDRLNLEANGPVYQTLVELVAAADHVVEAEVVAVDPGRLVGDPDAVILTQLAQVTVLFSVSSSTPATLIVEQEATLADGTPISVNGVAPLVVGQRVVLILVEGATEPFHYTTPVNEQAVFYLTDEGVRAAAASDDPIGRVFDGEPAETLRQALKLVD